MGTVDPIRFRFGEFEADIHAGELLRSGSRVPIQEKPFRILCMLLRQHGRLVTRKEIFEEVWPDTYVQEDQSLNTAVRKLRLALSDCPDAPVFIETVGSRGYRFIHPVQLLDEAQHVSPRGIRVAVLPFANLGPDPEEHFADGITEEMIARLGRLHPRFTVIAPGSVMRYKHAAKEITEILRELAVDYVLSCAVRRSGDRVRITSKLISGADESCLWSDTYDRALTDVFEIQNEIAEKIARSTTRLLTSPTATTSLTAHEAYLRGRYFWNKRTGPAMLKSIDYFRQAIMEDPEYAVAYVGLAEAYVMLSQHGVLSTSDALPKAKAAAETALRLDSTQAEARVPLSWVKMSYERDFAGAEAECRAVLQANPSYAFAYVSYAFLLTSQSRHAESLSALKRALHIDPVSLPTNTIYASALFFARLYDAAIEQCKECLELDPQFPTVHAIYGQALEAKGLLEEATSRFKIDAELAPWNPLAKTHLARVYARRGMFDDCRKILDSVLKTAQERYVPAFFVALVYAALRDSDTMFYWLDRAEKERSNWVLLMGTDSRLDPYRGDRRFSELLSKVGLTAIPPASSGFSANPYQGPAFFRSKDA